MNEQLTKVVGVALLLLVIATIAAAQSGTGTVEVRISSVLAADTNQGCDSRLTTLRRHLNRLFHYSTYRLVDREDRRTSFGQTLSVTLPGGRLLHIEPLAMDGDMIQMEIMLFEGGQPMMTTDFKIMNHGILMVGGPHYEQGALIISIEPFASQAPSAAPVAPAASHSTH